MAPWAETPALAAPGMRAIGLAPRNGPNKITPRSRSFDSTRSSSACLDGALLDSLSGYIRDSISDALREESAVFQGHVRDSVSQLESQQAALMKQQAIFMQAVLQHVQRITETLSNMQQEKCASLSTRQTFRREPTEQPGKPSFSDSPSSITAGSLPSFGADRHVVQATNIAVSDDIEALRDRTLAESVGDELVQGTVVGTAADLTQKHLRVTIVGCTGLRNTDNFSVSDPYCVCKVPQKPSFVGSEFHTPTIKNALNPQWYYTGIIAEYTAGDSLHFSVHDKDLYSEDVLLGEVTLGSKIIEQDGGFNGELELENAGHGYRPKLHVSIIVIDGPSPAHSRERHMHHSGTESFAQCLLDAIQDNGQLEDSIRHQEQERLKVQLIRKIPIVPLRDCLTRCVACLDDMKEPPRTGRIFEIESSKAFFCLSLVVVVADQMVTVASTNHAAATLDASMPSICQILERVFLGWFAFEVCVKLYVHRAFFFIGEHCKMNALDLFLVCYSSIEALGLNLSFLRALRVFKMAKVVRCMKALTQVRDLRVMMDCLINSWFAMFWAVVLIAFLTYMFALVFVQAMTDFAIKNKETLSSDVAEAILLRFGSVETGILSLFMALTGGFDWGELYDLVVLTGPVATITCIFFVLFFTISVWNIVGSIFVEKVMETAKPHPREELQQLRTQARVDAAEIKEFFYQFDQKATGTLNMDQFAKITEKGGLAEFMALRDVDFRDAADVASYFKMAQDDFCLTDGDPSPTSSVTIDALVTTFLKVKGHATSLDVAVLKHELSFLIDKQRDLQRSFDNLVDAIGEGGGQPRFCI